MIKIQHTQIGRRSTDFQLGKLTAEEDIEMKEIKEIKHDIKENNRQDNKEINIKDNTKEIKQNRPNLRYHA